MNSLNEDLENMESEIKSLINAEDALPPKLFILPVQGRPIYPGVFTPLMVNSGDDTKVIEKAYE